MKKSLKPGSVLLAWAVLSATTTPVLAQESDGETIDEIQVTATRRPVRAGDVSAALTVISSEDIDRAKLMTDALAARPGVFLQQTTPGQGAAIIRGLKGSEVLHIVDGMRLNNAIFRNAPTQYMALVAPGTVDRIEVVRGAPASLYGSDAVGGVVQALSRIPALDAPGVAGSAFVAFDTADLARLARASVEFGDEQIAALFSGEYLETGDRRVGGDERIGPSGYQSKGLRAAVSLTPGDGTSWLFDLQAARQPKTPRVDELVPGFGETEPASSEFWFSPNDRVFAHIRHEREEWLWNATLRFDLGWQRIVDDRISRGYLSTTRRYEENRSDLLGFTASANGETANGSWIVGAEIYHDDVASRRIEEDTLTGVTQEVVSRFPDGSTMDQAAIYGNYLRDIGDRNTLSGGLRYSSIGTDLPASGAVQAASVNQDDISADLGWVFDATEYLQVTANLGYGFRAPNVFDLGTLGERPGNRFNIPNPNLKSERITQFDIGIRHRSSRVDVDVTTFVLHYTDRISSVNTGATTPEGRDITQSQNVESADIVGVEIGGVWRITDRLDGDLVFNYVRGEQSNDAGEDEPGDRIPPLNGRLGLRYQFSESLELEPFAVFAAKQDRLSPRDVRDSRIDPNGTPGWITLNFRALYDLNDDWRITASLENLLDERYRVHGSGIDAPGRNFYLSLHYGW